VETSGVETVARRGGGSLFGNSEPIGSWVWSTGGKYGVLGERFMGVVGMEPEVVRGNCIAE